MSFLSFSREVFASARLLSFSSMAVSSSYNFRHFCSSYCYRIVLRLSMRFLSLISLIFSFSLASATLLKFYLSIRSRSSYTWHSANSISFCVSYACSLYSSLLRPFDNFVLQPSTYR